MRDASPPLVLAFGACVFLQRVSGNLKHPKNGLIFDANFEHPTYRIFTTQQKSKIILDTYLNSLHTKKHETAYTLHLLLKRLIYNTIRSVCICLMCMHTTRATHG